MAEPASGVAAAIGAELDEAPAPTLQPSLFPAAELATLPTDASRADALRQRKAGRPPGAINRRTAAFRDYVLARSHGQHPVDGLIEAYLRPVHDLAAELGCTKLEAFNAQRDCRRVVLEYVEGKMPVSVDLSVRAGIPLIFEGFGGDETAAIEHDEFQPLSVAPSHKLEDGELEDGS